MLSTSIPIVRFVIKICVKVLSKQLSTKTDIIFYGNTQLENALHSSVEIIN